MMKEFGSSTEEEEAEKQGEQQREEGEEEEMIMAVDMVTDGRLSFEEQEEGEDGDDMEAEESAEAEQRDMNDGVMAEREEEVEREEGEGAAKEVTEKPVTPGRWSPVCHLFLFCFFIQFSFILAASFFCLTLYMFSSSWMVI